MRLKCPLDKRYEPFVMDCLARIRQHSEETYRHSLNTAEIAYSLACEYGLSERRARDLYTAALVHDIGKTWVPADILHNPRITQEEFEIIKKHAEYGRQIADGHLSHEIVSMFSKHHEKINGSGYPNRITGDELSLEDRILQVSDVISATMLPRSYKGSYSKEKIFGILIDNASKQLLDEEVVTKAIENYDYLVQDVNVYLDNPNYDPIATLETADNNSTVYTIPSKADLERREQQIAEEEEFEEQKQ